MKEQGIDRRKFLALTAAAAVIPSSLLPSQGEQKLLQMGGYPINAETPLHLLTDYITPNELFFIRSHWNPQRVEARSWRLTIDGEVSRALQISLEELKAMPRTEITCILQCAGNGRGLFNPPIPGLQWKYGAVGNARWAGVSVRALLERAGLKGTAKHLHAYGADLPPFKVPPFYRSLELDKALRDAIVAYEMNHQPLPHLHGGPARLVVPGWAGDHWMKWLGRLAPSRDPQTGFFMDTAYRFPLKPGNPGVTFKPEEMKPVTDLFVKSNITSSPAESQQKVTAEIRGFAFSGAPDIAKVEWSGDGGQTWSEARLDSLHHPYAWRLWSFDWTPGSAGKHTLVVRATDSRGSIQPGQAVWNQSGYLYNGWHSVDVMVR